MHVCSPGWMRLEMRGPEKTDIATAKYHSVEQTNLGLNMITRPLQEIRLRTQHSLVA